MARQEFIAMTEDRSARFMGIAVAALFGAVLVMNALAF